MDRPTLSDCVTAAMFSPCGDFFLAISQKNKYNKGNNSQIVNLKTKVIILSNIADLIEAYILRQLAAKQDGKVELRRTDIADEISCAPSQISYVLSTRFTPAKGFVVESRRGLGGYIRIVQVPLKNLVYQDMMDKITEETDYATVQSMVHYLLQHAMITNREAALMMQVVSSVYQSEGMSPKERFHLLKSMLLTVENFS